MEVRQLRYFLAVGKHGHFTKAAHALGVSESTVSEAITKLEERLEVSLFTRGRGRRKLLRAVGLTRAGEELRVRANRVMEEIDSARLAVQEVHSQRYRQGAVHVVVAPEYREPVIGAVAAMLQTDITVRVRIDDQWHPGEVEGLVYDGAFDLGVVTLMTKHQQITYERLDTVPLQLIVNKNHPLASDKEPRDIRSLARARFVLPPVGSLEWFELFRIFGALEIEPEVVLQTSARDSILACVKANAALATVLAVPRHVDRRDLVFIDLPDVPVPSPPIATYLVWRGQEPRTEVARRVRNALRVHLGATAPTRG